MLFIDGHASWLPVVIIAQDVERGAFLDRLHAILALQGSDLSRGNGGRGRRHHHRVSGFDRVARVVGGALQRHLPEHPVLSFKEQVGPDQLPHAPRIGHIELLRRSNQRLLAIADQPLDIIRVNVLRPMVVGAVVIPVHPLRRTTPGPSPFRRRGCGWMNAGSQAYDWVAVHHLAPHTDPIASPASSRRNSSHGKTLRLRYGSPFPAT